MLLQVINGPFQHAANRPLTIRSLTFRHDQIRSEIREPLRCGPYLRRLQSESTTLDAAENLAVLFRTLSQCTGTNYPSSTGTS